MPGLLPTVLIFLLATAVAAVAGYRFSIRPQDEVIHRVDRGSARPASLQRRQTLNLRELIKDLGNLIPLSSKDLEWMQRRLTRAGIRHPNAIKGVYGAKALLGAGLGILTFALMTIWGVNPETNLGATMLGGAAGYMAPNAYILRRLRQRQRGLTAGLPAALDLLVLCIESGLALDQAMLQVAKELEEVYPEISQEFMSVNLELRAGKRRSEALIDLGERTGVMAVKKLMAVLVQADRFGTSITKSLRTHANFMRTQSRYQAEERAGRIAVKLIFPIFFCLLPSLFIFTLGPVIARVIRELGPILNNKISPGPY